MRRRGSDRHAKVGDPFTAFGIDEEIERPDDSYVPGVKLRLTLVTAACSIVLAGAFVWLHAGAPDDATCERSRFVDSDGFSAWPPGARCSYGEPRQTDVIVNGWFAAVVGGLAVALVIARDNLVPRTRPDERRDRRGEASARQADGVVGAEPFPRERICPIRSRVRSDGQRRSHKKGV
jgi:uncharacterized Zn-binding protein involved in type VI secretion